MLIPLGILAASGAGLVPDYELISTTVLGGTAASVTFSNLGDYSSTYKHLQIRATARSSRASTVDGLAVRLNGDSGSNYAQHSLQGNFNSVTSSGATSLTRSVVSIITGASSTANYFGGVVIDLLDPFSSTKNKTLRGFGGMASDFIRLDSGLYINTASVTSITLIQTEGANNLVAGSRFSLYGIRG
jgi:hypothetical protein